MTIQKIQAELEGRADAQIAEHSQRFFKTGPGEYGEGDLFRGIRVPELRKLARQYRDISQSDVEALLHSPYHEDRLLALLLLVEQYRRATDQEQAGIYNLYLANTEYINNWDLVDTSAEHIVGAYLAGRDRSPLLALAKSESLWERRIAVLATFHFIKAHEYDDSLQIAEILLNDPHDLIHKAAGWMLREIGNRNLEVEEAFLQQYYQEMPRTMLRYAIEKFSPPRRQAYLKGEI